MSVMRTGELLLQADGDLGWPLRRAAQLRGDAVAVVADGRLLTYRQLAERVGALGGALDELRLAIGARVGFLGVNSLAHVECWLGVPAFDRVLVDLNFCLAEDELAFMVDDCELEVLFVDLAQLEVARALGERCPSLLELVLDTAESVPEGCIAYDDLLAAQSPAEPHPADPDRLAAISYTGGTTGTPKGVMLSHGNLLANARHNLIATGHRPTDNWLQVCPMFHVAGTANVFACTWVGSRQTVLPRFDAAAVADTIEREQVTHTVLVPTMLAMLLDHLDQHPSRRLESLQHVQYAASPITPELQRRALERFLCEIVQFYGMTEAAPTVTSATAEDHRRGIAGEAPYARRLASIGAPVVGVEAEVRGEGGRRLPPGEVGEIWVRGPNVMLGYWNRPDVTASALAGGWYHTGDAAYADEDGYLYIVDRFKDMIITGGENVSPAEVEAVLFECPDIAEAAVVSRPDARWGEAVVAVVAPAPGVTLTRERVLALFGDRLARFKHPKDVLIVDALPRTALGKVRKDDVRRLVGGRLATAGATHEEPIG